MIKANMAAGDLLVLCGGFEKKRKCVTYDRHCCVVHPQMQPEEAHICLQTKTEQS